MAEVLCASCNSTLNIVPDRSDGQYNINLDYPTAMRHSGHSIVIVTPEGRSNPVSLNSPPQGSYQTTGPQRAYTEHPTPNNNQVMSQSPEVPIETGSYQDLKIFDPNSMAEPIMRIWQISEALSRMSRRIKKRYPEESAKLKTSSEDIIYSFYKNMEEEQKKFIDNQRTSEESAIKEMDVAHERKVKDEILKKNPVDTPPTSAGRPSGTLSAAERSE